MNEVREHDVAKSKYDMKEQEFSIAGAQNTQCVPLLAEQRNVSLLLAHAVKTMHNMTQAQFTTCLNDVSSTLDTAEATLTRNAQGKPAEQSNP